jgi:hypothetical protein
MLKVFDGLFADDFLMQSFLFYMTDVGWRVDNVANRKTFPPNSPLSKGSHRLLGVGWEAENIPEIAQVAYDWFLQRNGEEIEPVELHGVDCNLQSYMIDGTPHRDEYIGDNLDRTLLFFPHYKWKDHWGGNFETFDDNGNVQQSIEIKPGRMIYIDSSVLHRGLGPTHKYIYRVSVAYRLKVVK